MAAHDAMDNMSVRYAGNARDTDMAATRCSKGG